MQTAPKITSNTRRGCAYWLRLALVGLIGGFTIACVAIEIFYIYVTTEPSQSQICCQTPADLGFEYENVNFSSPDGVILSGWYTPSKNQAAVILLHGYGANRMEMLPRFEMLARHDFGVLAYDLRAHGESGGNQRAIGWPDVPDVFAALDYLQTRPDIDPNRIGILGFSVGGQIAIRAAAQDDRIQAVLADDPGFVTVADALPPENKTEWMLYTTNKIDAWGISLWTGTRPPEGVPAEIVKISPRPLMLIATGSLGQKLVRHFYALALEPKSLWEIPETYHGGEVRARPQEYEQRMIEFFSISLLKQEKDP
jgi:pimeloyl-ACP methyl ester carboxylesterase